MFALLKRLIWSSMNTDYPLNSIFGFDVHQLPLNSLCNQAPYLSLISELYTTAEPILAVSNHPSEGNNNPIENIADELETLLFRHHYNIKIRPVEIHDINGSLKERISNTCVSTLNDKYLFLDFKAHALPVDICNLLSAIEEKQLLPVLHFPEKNPHFDVKRQRLFQFKKCNCVFHIDLLSLSGFHGPRVKKVAYSLLQTNQVHFVSFQLHHLEQIRGDNGIKLSKKVADLLDEQLFSNLPL